MAIKPLSPKLQALVEEARRKHAEKLATQASASAVNLVKGAEAAPMLTASSSFHSSLPGINLNEQQLQAVELAMRGKSFNLIGAAGTGKTTTTREIIAQASRLPHVSMLEASTKYLIKGDLGIVIISFTNKAINNIKKFLSPELQRHCLTYHKLLQYEPVYYELEDGKKTMRFEPHYNEEVKLPHIPVIIVEESSMVGEDLHKNLLKALPNPHNVQFIFLGDLNQLPPIFGPSILGFKLTELPTVELTHVYRQALESPIITLAHKIREGRGIGQLMETGIKDDRGANGIVTLHPWKKKLEPGPACRVAQDFAIRLIKSGRFNPAEDVILCPFNKSFGTIELNRAIADYLGKERNAEVFEVIARYTKSYWAIGDRVLVDRQEAIIVGINSASGYTGPLPASPSKTLDRWGNDSAAADSPHKEDESIKLAKGQDILDNLVVCANGEDSTNVASHQIMVEFVDSGVREVIHSAGDVNSMVFSYCLTVHKSQGSEWNKVFIFLHYSHNTMLTRELLYTAVTRARQELFIICEPDRGKVYNSLTRAAKSPEITGVTLAEKAEYFQAKKRSMQRMSERATKSSESNMEEME